MKELEKLISDTLNTIGDFVWGVPLMVLLLGTGLALTVVLRGLQFTQLFQAFNFAFFRQKEEDCEIGNISHFQSLMTALSAVVGTGNIVGVAAAIALGGPGAWFWMWITGLVGMATKYAEALLAVKYRVVAPDGEVAGGPMYYLAKGIKWKGIGVHLGAIFAFFTAFAALGIGNLAQSHAVAATLQKTFHIPLYTTGLVLMGLTGVVILGGIKSIAKVASVIVPIMLVFYVVAGGYIIITHIFDLPAALLFIISDAFSPTAATGGFAGATLMMAIRSGVGRGIFSNESGLGSAPIVAATTQTKSPVRHALVAMTQTFLDTLIICTITGLVIVLTQSWMLEKVVEVEGVTKITSYTGVEIASKAFSLGMPGGQFAISISLMLFAYSTMLAWSYYGEKAVEYLFGRSLALFYRFVFIILIGIGSMVELKFAWTVSDILNGLMAFPNLIGLLFLMPVVIKETRAYFTPS